MLFRSLDDIALAQSRIDDALAGNVVRPEYVARANERLSGERGKHAINNWIDKKLTSYVKNQMATPEDPVRALAERGVLHYEPQGYSSSAQAMRHRAREQGNYFAGPVTEVGDTARGWEDVVDAIPSLSSYNEHVPFDLRNVSREDEIGRAHV